MYYPAIMRTTTIDPLAEKYYSISPYAWCGNNPVNLVDPDGMDIYMLNQQGKMFLALKEDNNDKVFSMDKNGRLNGKNITIMDKELLPQLANNSIAETANSNDAFNLFSFVADNSNVEWGLAGFKNGKKTNYVLNTDHDEMRVSYNRKGNKENNLKFHIHSHSGDDKASKVASGYELYNSGLSYGPSDAEFMKNRFNEAKNANRGWPADYPKLFFYHKNSNTLYHYNHKTASQKVGTVSMPALLRTLTFQFKMKP